MIDHPSLVDAVARSRSKRRRATLLAASLAFTLAALPVALTANSPLLGFLFGFEDPAEVGVVPEPTRVATSNIDRAGGNDIAITTRADDPADPGTLVVLVNDGSGLGYSQVPSMVGVDPRDVVLDDFDQVNGPDAAVANAGDGTVSILLNTGGAPDGLFEDARPVDVGGQPVAIASGDITLDGFADLAVANAGDSTVMILENDQSGGFALRQVLRIGAQPVDLALGDYYGANGLTDLIVVFDGAYQGYQNDGQGNFFLGDGGDIPGAPVVLEPEDVDGDKDVDAFVLSENLGGQGLPGTLTILRNQSGDGFETLTFPAGNAPSSLSIGDFDRDNDVDAMVVGEILGAEGDIRGVLAFRNTFRESGVIDLEFTQLLDVDPNQLFVSGDLLDQPGGPRDLVTIDVDPGKIPLRGNVAVLLGVPSCRGDINGDLIVGMADLQLVLEGWGPCELPCPPVCLADVDGDCEIAILDLIVVLSEWGPCP